MTRLCNKCNKEFYTKPARIKDNRGKFCSKTCANLDRSPRIIKDIVGLYTSGKTLRDIAKKYSCSPTSIKRILAENNIIRRLPNDRYYPKGDKHFAWKGGFNRAAHFYKMVLTENGRKYEHRLIMEKLLGRELRTDEHVHHLNHNPEDNRPENLVVLNAKEHLSYHAKLRWQT